MDGMRLGDIVLHQRVAGAGQGCCAQRQEVNALAHIGHACSVTGKHLDIGQHVVAKAHRLGHLQMGEAGQDDFDVFLGDGEQGFL